MTRKGEPTSAGSSASGPTTSRCPPKRARGAENITATYGLAKTLSGAPRPYHMCRTVATSFVFCLATLEDAQPFVERFGGELLTADN